MITNIAVVPARYGSKRVPHKNFCLLGGKPLFLYTVDQALKSRHIQKIVVSTDFSGIGQMLKGYDANKIIIHIRPEVLSGDLVTTEEVLINILEQDWAKGVEYVATLPPTAPFRSVDTIDKCIDLFLDKNADAVLSVTCAKIRSGSFDSQTKEFSFLMKDPPVKMRDWPLTAFDNSSVYITKSDIIKQKKFVLGQVNYAVETDRIQGHDINDPLDWAFAEVILKNGFLL